MCIYTEYTYNYTSSYNTIISIYYIINASDTNEIEITF